MELKIKRGVVGTDEVKQMIQIANEKADEWIEMLNDYYQFDPSNAEKAGMILFFPTNDGLNRTEIRWDDF